MRIRQSPLVLKYRARNRTEIGHVYVSAIKIKKKPRAHFISNKSHVYAVLYLLYICTQVKAKGEYIERYFWYTGCLHPITRLLSGTTAVQTDRRTKQTQVQRKQMKTKPPSLPPPLPYSPLLFFARNILVYSRWGVEGNLLKPSCQGLPSVWWH